MFFGPKIFENGSPCGLKSALLTFLLSLQIPRSTLDIFSLEKIEDRRKLRQL